MTLIAQSLDVLDPTPTDEDCPPIQVTEETVSRILRTRKTDRSEGVSGCSNVLVRTFATKGSDEQIKLFCVKVCGLFNFLLTGEASARVHPLWMDARGGAH